MNQCKKPSPRQSQHCRHTRANPRCPLRAELQLHQAMLMLVSYIFYNSILAQAFSPLKGKIWSLFLVSNGALMLHLSSGMFLVHDVESAVVFPQIYSMRYQAINYRPCHFQPRTVLTNVPGKRTDAKKGFLLWFMDRSNRIYKIRCCAIPLSLDKSPEGKFYK